MCEWSGHNVRVNMQCASASLVNVRVLVWSMCEWSGLYNTGMCETSLLNVRVVLILQHRNVRVVRFLQHWNVRVLVWLLCEWSGYYVRVRMECASASTVMCECE